MKDAYGGIFNIIYVVIFLVVTIGILGLVVSYTKAFKMKSAIISVIEEYEGSGCYGSGAGTQCRKKIEEAAKSLAYSPVSSLNCPSGFDRDPNNFYCYKMIRKHKNGKYYAIFTVITQVDISFPIVEKIMGFRFFQVSGDTKEIQMTS